MRHDLVIRKTVRILLINQENKLLLMCANDPKVTAKNGSYRGPFWFTIGGRIEPGEELIEAAIRELKEETGLDLQDVVFGPKVWFGEVELILSGQRTLMKQEFIVAHTKNSEITLKYLTDEEKKVIVKIDWFSLEDILNSEEIIYPIGLAEYLADILSENYPKEAIEVDLSQ